MSTYYEIEGEMTFPTQKIMDEALSELRAGRWLHEDNTMVTGDGDVATDINTGEPIVTINGLVFTIPPGSYTRMESAVIGLGKYLESSRAEGYLNGSSSEGGWYIDVWKGDMHISVNEDEFHKYIGEDSVSTMQCLDVSVDNNVKIFKFIKEEDKMPTIEDLAQILGVKDAEASKLLEDALALSRALFPVPDSEGFYPDEEYDDYEDVKADSFYEIQEKVIKAFNDIVYERLSPQIIKECIELFEAGKIRFSEDSSNQIFEGTSIETLVRFQKHGSFAKIPPEMDQKIESLGVIMKERTDEKNVYNESETATKSSQPLAKPSIQIGS